MMLREINIFSMRKGNVFSAISFYAIVLFCSALALGPDINVLHKCAPALYWILAILTTLFTIPLQVKQDENEGFLDEIIFAETPLGFVLLSKCFAETLLLGFPLMVTGIFLSPLFHMSLSDTIYITLTLVIGFPALSSLGYLGGLLTIHSRGSSLLLSFIILPLTIPLFLVSLSAFETAHLELDSFPSFCLLMGVSLMLTIVSLFAGTKALKLAVEG